MPRRSLAFVFIVFAMLATGLSTRAEAATIKWDKIIGIDIGKLSAQQKARVKTLLESIKNTRGCKDTLAVCLSKDDMTARRHAGFVARMVRKGKDDTSIKEGIKSRKESSHPEEILEIDTSDHPYKGNTKAKVVIIEYACFQCPFCAHLATKLKKLKSKFGNKIVHYFKFYPVLSHDRGVPSALAGLAAHRQGKFWPMHDIMFKNRSDLDDEDLAKYAKKIGLDMTKFKQALNDKSSMKYVERDKLEGMRIGVEGTPTFFINGKLFDGVQDYEEIVDRIAEELDIVEGRIK
ncbi:MAG: thioredoxin domain-containing protein [Deltaproteobacteria bacterium]|nr:thioredoxin domain-containing protein [Deltaproteobacteria bacterium]